MNRISITEARIRRLLPTLAERPTGTRIDWMHPDPEPGDDENTTSRGA